VEWQATALTTPVAWGLAACIALLLISWARTGSVPARQVVYGLAFVAFGLMAYRNAVFASLLLLPLVTSGVDAAFPRLTTRATVPLWALYALVPILLLASVTTYVQHAHISTNLPQKIAARLATQPNVHHVVATYNTTGYIRAFAGAHVRMSLDGRSDRYGTHRINAQNDMLDGMRGWEHGLAALRPDAVVMSKTSPLRELLSERSWTTVMVDGEYVLMEPTS
jgi:hypothetical protein